MGKGDVKTKKGKRFRGSYGVTRPRKSSSNTVKSLVKEDSKPVTKKAPAKKSSKKSSEE